MKNVHNYRMLKAPVKSIIFVVLLTLSSSTLLRAEVKIYQYDGKLPFVQMMLNMMVAMGVLDRLPAYGYGVSPYGYGSSYPGLSPWSSPLSAYSNPYQRALAMRGFSPDSYSPYSGIGNLYSGRGLNPFIRSPWMQSPWSQGPAGNSLWGNPGWGVLPLDSYPGSYAVNNTPWLAPQQPVSELDGWVNEPWETSTWNPDAENAEPAAAGQASQSAPPVVQNFNFNVPDTASDNKGQQNSTQRQGGNSGPGASTNSHNRGNSQYSRSPLAKLATPPQQRQDVRRPNRPPVQAVKRSPLSKQSRKKYVEKPCITDFCGLKKPNINGLWVTQTGEMLGIKDNRFLWSDGESRYLSGRIKLKSDVLIANVEGSDQLMQFKYRLSGNRLLTMQPDGLVREFVRMPVNQPVVQYNEPYAVPYQGY